MTATRFLGNASGTMPGNELPGAKKDQRATIVIWKKMRLAVVRGPQ
jgi:hypothetical protein